MGFNIFPVLCFFFNFAHFKKQSFLSFQMPPQKPSCYLFFLQSTVLFSVLLDFIHLCSLYWEEVYVRKIGDQFGKTEAE